MKLELRFEVIAVMILSIITSFVLAIFFAWPMQLLWNSCLVPAVNELNTVGYWQMVGITLLFDLLSRTIVKISKLND